eukprot:TRINITY_DN11054_c1_g1_i1.p1 TRINITY_DN11054_c1_g1~~TRINITY_DN11054_c1_g1_i1.p1  ORF type:complete len:343 (+),score=143.69 TRINITY_DN11054_c1_g1_i1:114-1142(+)
MTAGKEARLSFIVDYDDPQAGLVRKYQLSYYSTDNTIEMHDIKNRRMFLKRCNYPQVKPSDLYQGATITVYSRKLLVTGYADAATAQVYNLESSRGLVVVPPGSFDDVGKVLTGLQGAGLRVKNLNTLRLTAGEAAELDPGVSDSWHTDTLVAIEVIGSDPQGKWEALEKRAGYGTWFNVDPDFFFGRGSARLDRSSATLENCTLCIVKPHAVKAAGGHIITDILAQGFEISAIKMINLSAADACDFLEVYKGVLPEYTRLVEHLSSGPCWVMEVRGENPVGDFRELCGPHDPDIAKVLRPTTLRSKYGTTRVENAVHCTDLPEDGVTEADFFFNLLRPMSA